ncbi:MAG TPA: J domain-containing protein [Burkholderiales bacterium]|nr:J domain-containing protein [Burkholderiales bacterium]
MLTPRGKSLSIASGTIKSQLSKGQKTFNTLIRQIEQGRSRLAAWEIAIPRYQQKHASELQPLIESAQQLEIKTVHALDQVHDQNGLTNIERRKIATVIARRAEALLAVYDDSALKALYNKHSGLDYDEVQAEEQVRLKTALEDALGIDLGDDFDMSSPDRFTEQAEAHIRKKRAEEDAARQARQESRAERKKSPKQLAMEAREQADEQQLRQSIRDIYRKLASALHPDRETDPQECERKTALMQKVNQAYDKNNLLQLLELQLELEQIDQHHINNVSEERLKHYNKILREQLTELKHEILRVESGFVAQYQFDPYEEPDPNTIMQHLAIAVASVKMDLHDLKKDLHAFEDSKRLKVWLKRVRLPRRKNNFDDVPS